MLKEVVLKNTVSLAEAAGLVEHAGEHVSFIFQGEMGIGKSHILKELGRRMPDHVAMYADLPTLDIADISGVPWVEEHAAAGKTIKITRFAPNAMLNIHNGRPVLFMADEIGKAPRAVQNSILRLLHEQKIGEHSLPKGSRVFGTTNLMAEGLGDMVQTHAQLRCSFVTVRKSTAEEWITNYALPNNLHPIIVAWVKRYPICMASFMDGEGNPYIHYPNAAIKTNRACVTPRGLEKASYILFAMEKIGHNATMAALAGCLGDAAARDILVFIEAHARMPSWESIVAAPTSCPVPSETDFAACFNIVFCAVSQISVGSIDSFMKYVVRLPKTYQCIFALNALTSPKRAIVLNNRAFVIWATNNQWLL